MKKRIALVGALSAFFAAPAYGYNVASVMLNSAVLDTVKQMVPYVMTTDYTVHMRLDLILICSLSALSHTLHHLMN